MAVAASVVHVICLALMSALAAQRAAAGVELVELVELNDANQAALNLELSKALAGVQGAYGSEFKFASVRELRKFLDQCELVNESVGQAQDSAFNGLAKQVKAVMAEPSIAAACSVTGAQVPEEMDRLDDLSKGDTVYAPLSTNVLNLLESLNARLKAEPNFRTLAAHLIESKIHELTETLLTGAPSDIELMIGETAPARHLFDIEIRHRAFCEINLIKPICKLVRSTQLDVPAIAADFDKFAKALASGAAEVRESAEKSGVTLEELKANCSKLQRDLRPVEQINKYVAAGLLNEERLLAHRQTNPSLDGYVALFDLCQQAQA